MTGKHDEPAASQYRVQVGHVNVSVEGNSPDQAINNAKKLLCLELPRLWDVISALDNSRFRIWPVERSPSSG